MKLWKEENRTNAQTLVDWLFSVIWFTSNNGDRDSNKGNNTDMGMDNNMDSADMCNNMDGVAAGIPY
jgi:hypothetical protein